MVSQGASSQKGAGGIEWLNATREVGCEALGMGSAEKAVPPSPETC